MEELTDRVRRIVNSLDGWNNIRSDEARSEYRRIISEELESYANWSARRCAEIAENEACSSNPFAAAEEIRREFGI